jgi:hypothetical protein
MGLFTNPGWYAGGLLPGLIANNFGGSSDSSAPVQINRPPMQASGVGVPSDLSGAISGAGTNAYNAIGAGYNNARQKMVSDARARGLPPGAGGPNSYGGNQASTYQNLDTGNLAAALGGGLGNTAYQNSLQSRQFQQNEDLAQQVAALNRPDLLQQILGGLAGVGKTAATYYGMGGFGGRGGGSGMRYAGGGGSMPPNLSLIPGGGYAQYMGGPY